MGIVLCCILMSCNVEFAEVTGGDNAAIGKGDMNGGGDDAERQAPDAGRKQRPARAGARSAKGRHRRAGSRHLHVSRFVIMGRFRDPDGSRCLPIPDADQPGGQASVIEKVSLKPPRFPNIRVRGGFVCLSKKAAESRRISGKAKRFTARPLFDFLRFFPLRKH